MMKTLRMGLAGFLLVAAGVCVAQPTFPTPDAAVAALVAALERDDLVALQDLLGPDSEDILDSGDAVADKATRTNFLELYKKKHALVPDSDDSASVTLQVGDDDWPLPIPVVKRDGQWLLDGAAGADEVVYRRIGRNELGAISVCRGFLDAQAEYAASGHDGNPPGVYADKLLSAPGKQDGLYWPTAEGDTPSPLGDAMAEAAEEGYQRVAGQPRLPYHGYYYRALFAQGAHAQGGAQEYFVDGLLTQGVAMLAWPAEYGVSGIKTFIVNHDGVVYEKDLGEDTETLVEKIELFDPDSSWTAVAEDAAQ
ncbi:MAG TPA: DUF2950 domain-containing protein [Pseudomonadales bacterium]|nr:DUF2950 domain-containing protein [Pseudomonadales bacterium]